MDRRPQTDETASEDDDVPERAPTPLLQSAWTTSAANAGMLVVNAFSGVLIARLLDPEGKGTVAAISTWTQMGSWIFVVGVPAATTYLLSRRLADPRRVTGTAVLAGVALGTLAMVATQGLLYFVFSTQPDDVRWLAHVFALAVYLLVFTDLFSAAIAGEQDFLFLNLTRIARPSLKVLLFLGLWLTVGLTVARVLIALAISEAVIAVATGLRVARTVGFGRPDTALLRNELGYGVRIQGGQLAGLTNHRLDILLMPIFLSATAIGLYSVSVSVASVVFGIVGGLGLIVFPAAARAGDQGGFLVSRALRLSLLLAVAMSAPLLVLAPGLVSVVYGTDYADAVPALRILLLGYVFKCGSSILVAGLKAEGRPLAASTGEFVAVPITIIGLVLVLESHGIEGAAVVSSIAYVLSFLVVLRLASRAGSIAEMLSPRRLGEDLRHLRRRVRRRSRPA